MFLHVDAPESRSLGRDYRGRDPSSVFGELFRSAFGPSAECRYYLHNLKLAGCVIGNYEREVPYPLILGWEGWVFVLFFYDRVASDRMVRSTAWLIYLASSFGAAKNSPRFGGLAGREVSGIGQRPSQGSCLMIGL